MIWSSVVFADASNQLKIMQKENCFVFIRKSGGEEEENKMKIEFAS